MAMDYTKSDDLPSYAEQLLADLGTCSFRAINKWYTECSFMLV